MSSTCYVLVCSSKLIFIHNCGPPIYYCGKNCYIKIIIHIKSTCIVNIKIYTVKSLNTKTYTPI